MAGCSRSRSHSRSAAARTASVPKPSRPIGPRLRRRPGLRPPPTRSPSHRPPLTRSPSRPRASGARSASSSATGRSKPRRPRCAPSVATIRSARRQTSSKRGTGDARRRAMKNGTLASTPAWRRKQPPSRGSRLASSLQPAVPSPGAGVAEIVFVSMSTQRRTSRPISSLATKIFGYGVSFSITPLEHLLAIARAIS